MTSKVTKDDVARLIEGKPSKNRVGSRAVRHRLRNDEKTKLEVARGRGYLMVDERSRDALRNSWDMMCQAEGRRCVYIEKGRDGYVVVLDEDGSWLTREFDSKDEAVKWCVERDKHS